MNRKPFVEKAGFPYDIVNLLTGRRLHREPERTLANGGKVSEIPNPSGAAYLARVTQQKILTKDDEALIKELLFQNQINNAHSLILALSKRIMAITEWSQEDRAAMIEYRNYVEEYIKDENEKKHF